ncbi:hypothetical protein GTP41_17695 [Pseudoduganella sp. DS3]|uniref:Uncharacterized protein n=1 Tax=Pseudoduganella guangdongensis TaxID=2692179 RepID=A0A6N9HJU3_9BURK|nr:hypothetical protein [Pseudoduganella guangdongensis]MYN03931.1 hypothetical protein [Pseudoduganella guangdongensis]
MKQLFTSFILTSAIASSAASAQSINFNFAGLGNSPLATQLQTHAGLWRDEWSRAKVQAFLDDFRSRYPNGSDVRSVLADAGLDCAQPPEDICTYAGVYTYDLGRPGYPPKRGAVRMDVVVNFDKAPWDVKATHEHIYGGVKK